MKSPFSNIEENFRTPLKKIKTSENTNSSFNSYQRSALKTANISGNGFLSKNTQLFMVFPILPKDESFNL